MCAFTPSSIPAAPTAAFNGGQITNGLSIEPAADATTTTALTISAGALLTSQLVYTTDANGSHPFRITTTSVTIGGTNANGGYVECTDAGVEVWGDGANDNGAAIKCGVSQTLAFYGTAPIAKPNVGAVPTALSITTALVALGLVSSS